MDKLIFLGTGSGSAVMITQEINTSALYFEINGVHFVLDPGPGTLINAKRYKVDLRKIDGVLLSHPHPDHCADADPIITAFQYFGKPGFLLANRLCLEPSAQFWPVVSKYHIQIPKTVVAMSAGDRQAIQNISFEATRCVHYGCGMGFKISAPKVSVGYTGNGAYFRGQEKQYEGCSIIIFDTLFPSGAVNVGEHITVEGVIDFLKEIKTKPRLAIIQHFSGDFLRAGPAKQARLIQKATGVKTVAANDGMKVDL